MYELEYVRKRKRRLIVALVGGISAMAISSLAIISFLGRFVGTFTVSLEARNVDIALSEKRSGSHSSYLRVKQLSHFQEFTYADFDRRFGDEVIDNEETNYTLGANYSSTDSSKIESLNFFKYTFYVQNAGSTPAKYDFSLNIIENILSSDGRSLIDTLRVMVYEDGKKTIYGKAVDSGHYDEAGNPDYRPPISVDEHDATESNPFMGYAETFASPKVVTTFSGKQINVGDAKRYTIVTWLEGNLSSNTENAPQGATIKLGVEINAYENE